MRTTYRLFLLLLWLLLPRTSLQAAEDEVWLLSFFRGNGEAGVSWAWSEDGLRF